MGTEFARTDVVHEVVETSVKGGPSVVHPVPQEALTVKAGRNAHHPRRVELRCHGCKAVVRGSPNEQEESASPRRLASGCRTAFSPRQS